MKHSTGKGLRPRWAAVLMLAAVLVCAAPQPASANIPLIARGLGRTLSAVFSLPASMMADSVRGGFPLGLIMGTVRGTMQAITGTVVGAIDMARGAAPYAKYLVFL